MTATTSLEAELQRVSRTVARGFAAKRERDELIHAALVAGITQTRISELTGLTRARIGQLAVRFPDRKHQNGRAQLAAERKP